MRYTTQISLAPTQLANTRDGRMSINTREPRVRTDGSASQEGTQTLSLRTVGLKSTLNPDSASTVLSLRTSGL